MTQPQVRRSGTSTPTQYSGFAVGVTVFAAVMAMMAGVLQSLNGLVAIFNDEFYVATREYIFKFDVTTWGWIHLLLGIVLIAAGAALFGGATWARAAIVVAAVLVAIANFMSLPWYPIWGIIMIAASVLVIWAVTAHGKDIASMKL